MARFLEKEGMEGVMDCERSVITMKLFRLDYLVYGLGNCVDDTSTETDLNPCGENKSERIPAPKSTKGRWPIASQNNFDAAAAAMVFQRERERDALSQFISLL